MTVSIKNKSNDTTPTVACAHVPSPQGHAAHAQSPARQYQRVTFVTLYIMNENIGSRGYLLLPVLEIVHVDVPVVMAHAHRQHYYTNLYTKTIKHTELLNISLNGKLMDFVEFFW